MGFLVGPAPPTAGAPNFVLMLGDSEIFADEAETEEEGRDEERAWPCERFVRDEWGFGLALVGWGFWVDTLDEPVWGAP